MPLEGTNGDRVLEHLRKNRNNRPIIINPNAYRGVRYEYFSFFTQGERVFLSELWSRSGLPTHNVFSVVPFKNTAELAARGLDTRGILIDPGGVYYPGQGVIGFNTSLFRPTQWKIRFNGVQYEMKWSTADCLIHELAHACSPSISPGTHPTIAANKRRYYGGESGRVRALGLLEQMSRRIISSGRSVNDYHAYNYAMYASGRMPREQYLDEVFAIFVETMFTRLNFVENFVKSGLMTRADGDQLYAMVANVIGCSVPALHERINKTYDMVVREDAYFRHLKIGRVAA